MGRRGGEMSRALEGIVRRVGLWANGGRVEESLIFRATLGEGAARLRVVGSFERERPWPGAAATGLILSICLRGLIAWCAVPGVVLNVALGVAR